MSHKTWFWIQKYFSPDSLLVDIYLLLRKSNGIIPKNPNSIPTQQITQVVADTLTIGPRSIK